LLTFGIVISLNGCDDLTRPNVDVITTKLFFSMAIDEMAFSFNPNTPTSEHPRLRKGYFRFTELPAELVKHSLRSLNVSSILFVVLVHPQSCCEAIDETVLSNDTDDFLNSCEFPKLNTISKSGLSDSHIRVQSEVRSRFAFSVLDDLRGDSSYDTIFEHLGFAMLRGDQITLLFDLATFDPFHPL
jgi:hypothetical protein